MGSIECLDVSFRHDGRDGNGSFKMVFKLQHQGHQSYGQSFKVEFVNGVSIAEVPGDVKAEVCERVLRIERKNQLNENGMTEIWIKLWSEFQPDVVKIFDLECQQTEEKELNFVNAGNTKTSGDADEKKDSQGADRNGKTDFQDAVEEIPSSVKEDGKAADLVGTDMKPAGVHMSRAKWYEKAVFYHIYPLGLCGCKKENTGEPESHFDKIRAWTDHAARMNFTAIYIGPLFESVGHGYETTDYRKVDCRLGTNQDFKEYVEYCHSIGIKVIVDGVFNHVGREFFAFKDVKEKREGSGYCGWFRGLNFGGNNEYNDGFCYENWGGYNLLVKLNQQNPEVQNYIFDVIRFWVSEFDIDGIRLDAADVLDFGFMKGLRHVADEVKPDFWLMGEVIHGDYSRWANDEMLHSVTNYDLHKGLFSGHNDHNYFEIAHTVKRLNDLCRGRKLYTFIDNHDVERIRNKLNNIEHLSLVTMLLYTLNGIPSMYYGSDFAVEGKKEKGSDWNLRPALELSDFKEAYEKNGMTKLCMRLGALKKEYGELTDGEYRELLLLNRQFAFGRVCEKTAVITALNNDDGEAVLEFGAPVAASNLYDLLGNARVAELKDGRIRVVLSLNSGTVLYLF